MLTAVLSRWQRNFEDDANGEPRIVENLADVVAGTKQAAEISGAAIIDLNAASTQYLNAIGPEDAWTYNLNPDDETHLNDVGSVVFGNLVAHLLDQELPKLRKWVRPERQIVQAIKEGVYIFPESDNE